MRSNETSTYLSRSRRAQLVAAAIDVIATRGYANTSLSDIAAGAGTSKGVLLYHFAGRDDVIDAVVSEVLQVAGDSIGPTVAAADGAQARLATFITERIGFLATHRAHMQALLEIWVGYRDESGALVLDDRTAEPNLEAIEALLRAGQSDGVFRDFPTRPMAVSISQAIDGVLLQLVTHPDLDIGLYAREIATIFDRATRRTP